MLKISLIQSDFSDDPQDNNALVIDYLYKAKKDGAQIVLPPELYLNHYFCKNQNDSFFDLALPIDANPYLEAIKKVCKELELVVPFSFFEKAGPNYFIFLAVVDADGELLGVYRKSHIPDGDGYQEKYYFRPGNTGFKVFATKYGKIGCGICWDQWFPEAARIMSLMGAEILLYPTAIGSEPNAPDLNTKDPWQRVMQGHAVANMIPIAASNRLGTEGAQNFYGYSFVCDEFGEIQNNPDQNSGLITCALDLVKAKTRRDSFGFFRDRRVDLYKQLLE